MEDNRAKDMVFQRVVMEIMFEENKRAYKAYVENPNGIPVKQFHNIEQYINETLIEFSKANHADTVLMNGDVEEKRIKGNYQDKQAGYE